MAKSEKSQFAERLRLAREQMREMNQAEVALKAGLPATAISHFESGARKPSFDSLRRLSNALNVTTDWLLGLVDLPEQSSVADPLYRHIQNLSENDRESARVVIEALANKAQQKK